jgi:hypothetical protein
MEYDVTFTRRLELLFSLSVNRSGIPSQTSNIHSSLIIYLEIHWIFEYSVYPQEYENPIVFND